MSRRRCKEITTRGTRCTRQPKKKGFCFVHGRMRSGKPGMIARLQVLPSSTYDATIISAKKNGKELSLVMVVNWIVNKATVKELEVIETLTPAIGK